MPSVLIPATIALLIFSESNLYVKIAMCVAALVTSGRFMLLRTPKQDVKSYLYYYNVRTVLYLHFGCILMATIMCRSGSVFLMSASLG